MNVGFSLTKKFRLEILGMILILMNTYLAIITTVLVLTQIVRVTQNAIQLHRMDKRITKDLAWIKDNDISEKDFEVQREVYYLLLNKLRDHPDESGDVTEW